MEKNGDKRIRICCRGIVMGVNEQKSYIDKTWEWNWIYKELSYSSY